MKFAVAVTEHFWTILLFALIAGVAFDFFFRDGIAATIALPFLAFLLALGCSAFINQTKAEAALAKEKEQLKQCVKFADRDAQSMFEYPQEGYRCPAMDGQPPVERWINK